MSWHLVGGGTGPSTTVVAAVHGMADHWTTWRALTHRLGDRFRCYALDAPWSGAGWHLPDGPGGWVQQTLRTLPEPADVLIGHSFGANAVLDHLADGPGPGPRAAVLLAPLVRPGSTAPRPVLLERTRAALHEVITEGLRARLGTRATAVTDDVLAGMADLVVEGLPDAATHLVLDRILDTPRPALAAIRTPTLVLSGRRDQLLAGVRPESLAGMPAADVRIRERYDHFCHITQAAEVAAECVEFLNRLPLEVSA